MATEITSIMLAMLTFVNGLGWLVDRRKHKQEVRNMKNDNQMKEMGLAKKYVDEYDRTIAQRLRNDVDELRKEVNQLKDVLQKIQECPYDLAACPVFNELLEQQKVGKPNSGLPKD